jgi:hypothetical protein
MQLIAAVHAKGIPMWKALAACFAATVILVSAVQAEAGATLDRVRSKKVLRCGVSEGLTGFSILDPSGRWTGMDADFCRAVAAAVGPGVKVESVPLTASARFVAQEKVLSCILFLRAEVEAQNKEDPYIRVSMVNRYCLVYV